MTPSTPRRQKSGGPRVRVGILAVAVIPPALGATPALAQGRPRVDVPYGKPLAAEPLKPLPPPPAPPVLEPPPKDSGPEGLAALSQMAAAIAAIRGGSAAQKGYWQGTAEGNRERRDRAYADWRARNEVAVANYRLQSEAWDDQAAGVRSLLDRLDRDCLSQRGPAQPPPSRRLERGPQPGKTETQAVDCQEATIKADASSGDDIVMQSGSVFEVLPGDTIDSARYLSPP